MLVDLFWFPIVRDSLDHRFFATRDYCSVGVDFVVFFALLDVVISFLRAVYIRHHINSSHQTTSISILSLILSELTIVHLMGCPNDKIGHG